MNRLKVVVISAIVAGGLSLIAPGSAQAAVGVFDCQSVFVLNPSLGLVNASGCTGTPGGTQGTINHVPLHRSYWCQSVQVSPLIPTIVNGAGCVRTA
jgi:hypothetical protein